MLLQLVLANESSWEMSSLLETTASGQTLLDGGVKKLKVSIRLMGDKESVYLLVNSLSRDLRLGWKEYPVYDLDDRTKILQGQVRLFATVSERDLDRLAGRQKPCKSPSLLDFCDQMRQSD
jgi:hypothetical protein